MKNETRRKFGDISGWTSGGFSFLYHETDWSGLFQFRDIFWEIFHGSFSCHSFYSGNRDMTKILMNKLREILFLNSTDSWDNNILVSVIIYLEIFDLKIVNIVLRNHLYIYRWFQHWKTQNPYEDEPRRKFGDISGWTSGSFSFLYHETDWSGLFQFRDIFWEIFHRSFSCHSF